MTSNPTTHPCTSPACTSFFPTPSDLRFHTLTTHLPSNVSSLTPLHICLLPLPHTPIGHCDLSFPSASSLRSHLQHTHNKLPLPPSCLTGNDKAAFQANHTIGPLTGRFWCGFCRMAVAVKGGATYGVGKGDEVGRWYVARREHVQAHFLGWNGVVAGSDLWVELGDGGEEEGKGEGGGVDGGERGGGGAGGGGDNDGGEGVFRSKEKGKAREW